MKSNDIIQEYFDKIRSISDFETRDKMNHLNEMIDKDKEDIESI